ncbi:hypothetical protein [Paenibacillus mucilaginosus]|uniref:Non-reducing end beta-L-arabinofuranosidase-like GH127 C-terminal domain-containing protein n=1 Tax=Paenibacillus mucilaginosus (strain KNP414) TaxID=1036673 RepID=F8F7V6_PAEMK|nr:hypothetical protein [Paenibacillus mucilaginosus]AEI40860.1 hypothetical protein KNP414_02299 [Paenibacillus mucilaginosus KNP414]MCG7211674.1 hypothetical protein [Paenibacillus mucilaginosus]WDM29969.1 hypothetical protein KCX80_12820 [Paenibacillus mucilaginosus]
MLPPVALYFVRSKSDDGRGAVLLPLQAVPYFAWSNRTPGEMTVWIRSS